MYYLSFSHQIVCLYTNNIFLSKFQNFKILDMFPNKSDTKIFSKPSGITVKNLVTIHGMVWICIRDKKSELAFIV